MENRYNQIMKNIEVTAEMRDRILNNIGNLDLDNIPKKTAPCHNYKRYLSAAACFVFLLIGSILIRSAVKVPGKPPLFGETAILEHSTINELSKAVGFTVQELHNLPFDAETVQYLSFWGELAEIEYSAGNHTVVFRMAYGEDDISGDYTEYSLIENRRVYGYDVTLKGIGDKFNLAVWKHDDFSYSIRIMDGISENELLDMVQSIP